MKNFFIALFVFFIWGGLGLYYLHKNASFKYGDAFEQIEVKNDSNQIKNDINVHQNNASLIPESGQYPDNSIVSNEMQNTVTSIKERQEAGKIKSIDPKVKDLEFKTENTNNTIELYLTFSYGELIADKDLIAHCEQLQRMVKKYPGTEITLIGHYNEEDSALDNYFEGLKRAKLLKHYMTSNFNIAEKQISAISEGNSNSLENTDIASAKNNRIELITVTRSNGG